LAGKRRTAGYAVQRVFRVEGGLKAYGDEPDMLLKVAGARSCPFCPDGHRLRLHGHYHRFALLPDGVEVRLAVRRLLCAPTGQTVSLLPDFCTPRRQHGPEILGVLLHGYAVGGMPLLAALRAARPAAAGHSVAQALRDGFLARAGPIRAFLARLRHRAIEPPLASGRRREVAALLVGLCLGFATAGHALVVHGVALHAMAGIGFA